MKNYSTIIQHIIKENINGFNLVFAKKYNNALLLSPNGGKCCCVVELCSVDIFSILSTFNFTSRKNVFPSLHTVYCCAYGTTYTVKYAAYNKASKQSSN